VSASKSFSGFKFLPAPEMPDVALIIILCPLIKSAIGRRLKSDAVG
jgi:hypothetical protein